MKWEGYVIRKIYTTRGESYIYIKGGYVKDDSKHTFIFPDECYISERFAKMVISKYKQSHLIDRATLNVDPLERDVIYEIVKVIDGHIQN